MNSGSPFRLLPDYDSDPADDNSGKDIQALVENLSPVTDSPSGTAAKSENVFSELSDASLSDKPLLLDNTTEDKESQTTAISSGATNKHIEDKNEDGTFVNPEKDYLGGSGVYGISDSGEFQKENEEKVANSTPVPYKVDEFGRYLRQGASDSDSDDSRHGRRRKRGRSRSRSPAHRRSPWKRREKRSRSRSWSPRSRRRRSRSRTPTIRHADESIGVNKRWGICFDFVRGKCYRGASCCYLHSNSHNRDKSRRLGSKEYSEVSPDSKNYITPKLSVHGDGDVKKQEKEHHQDTQGSFCGAGNDGNFPQEKEDCSRDAQHTCQERHSINSRTRGSPSASGVAPEGPETKIIQEEPEQMNCHDIVQSPQPAFVDSFPGQSVSDADAPKSLDDTSVDAPALNPVIEPSSIMSSSTQAYLSSTSMSQHHLSAQFSYQSFTHKESSPPRSSPEATHHPSQLKLPPPPPLLQGENMPHMPLTSSMPPKYAAEVMHRPPLLHLRPSSQPLQAGSVAHMAQTSFLSSQSVPRECFRPFIFPYQQSNFNVPPSSSWNSMPVLPPPPPPPVRPPSYADIAHSGIAAPSVTSQSQQSNLLPRNDSDAFLRRYPTQLPIRSQVNEFQRQVYPPMQENYHAVSHTGDFRLNNLPAGNPPIHVQHLVQTGSVKNSFPMGSMHLQPTPEPRELSVNKVQPLTGDNLLPSEHIKSSSHLHPYSQQQQLHTTTDSLLGHPDKISSSHFQPNLPDMNHPSHLSDFGRSGIPTSYNPYASTFEQPLSSKLCPKEFREENSCGLSHPLFDQQGLGSLQTICPSTNSARATGHIYPSTGKDQYDPLHDSIEPSSSSFKKSDHFQMQGTASDSNVLRLSGSNKPADVEGNSNKTGTISVTMFADNEEFGETGDAEVGAVENGSSSDPIDSTDMNAGEVEIDQVKSSGKSKKNKDSRSMKVFKIALADFVKEVLKPSWRQGNMSKEAFKTIVKKTVEKVSRAMKKHQIPKSKPKIDQYIDSSQRKLTKLVMGYVDKYVKA